MGFEKIEQTVLRNFDFCANCANSFAQICAYLILVACDAEQCGILRKSCFASCANDPQKFAKKIA